MKYIRSRLGLKLFVSYLAVILVGMIVIGIAARFTTPLAFERHMMHYGGQFGMGRMMGQGGDGMMPELFANFQDSFNEALITAAAAAGGVAILVSLLFSRNIVAPLRAMMSASQRIAEGHYDERVRTGGSDELGQLAGRFNQMAERLEQVEAMRRRLIGDVAHELRTPLAAIQGSLEGLVDGVLPATPETYGQIHAEAARLSRLVDDLQELSRVEARAYELDIQPVDVDVLVRTVTKRLGRQFDEKRVKLNSSLPPAPMRLLADEDRIVQVLTNLVGNALQHTPQGGHVTIAAERVGSEAYIRVLDTGMGIPAEHLSHIFDRFYRVDKSRSRPHGGSGVGLTIAKHLVEAHGGKIWAESAGEGKGSVFTFTLPLAE